MSKRNLQTAGITHILTVADKIQPMHPNEFEYKVINEKLYEIPYIAINKNNMYPTDESSHKVYTVLSGEFVRWGNNCNTHIVQFSGWTTNVL